MKGVFLMMKFSIVLLFGSLALVGCSNSNPVHPESTAAFAASPSAAATAAHPSPDAGFGFNGIVSGFPTGRVFVSGGGTFDLVSRFVKSSGGFSWLLKVLQGPLSTSKNPNDPGPCLQGQGVRWDTVELLPTTPNGFKCTGAASELLKQANTGDKRVVLLA